MFHTIAGHTHGVFYISSVKRDPDNNTLIFYLMNGGSIREQYGSQDEMENTYNEFMNKGLFVEIDNRLFNTIHFSTIDTVDLDVDYFVHIVLRTGETIMAKFDTAAERDEFYEEIMNSSMSGGLVQVDTYSDLPEKGNQGCIYITKDTGQTYYWDDNSQTYITVGTSGRTGVYSYDGELPTTVGTDTTVNKTDLEEIVAPTVPFSEGSEVSAANAIHGLIIASTATTVTVKTITDMTIDSFRQVATVADLPSTGISNVLYAVKDIKEFRVWDSSTSSYETFPIKPTGVNNAQIHTTVSATNEIEAELQEESVSKTHLTTTLQNEIDSKLDEVVGVDNTQIHVDITNNNEIEAVLQNGSVSKTHLTTALQNDLNSLTVLPTYNSTTHKITFTTLGGSTYEIDLPMENAVDDVSYNSTTGIITVHKLDGTSSTIDLSNLANYTAGNGIDIVNGEIKIKLDIDDTNGLVATADGLGLNTVTETTAGAMSAADKVKLNSLENYDDTAIQAALGNKVDKIAGKGLSTNDYTDAEKTKLANLENYDDTTIRGLLDLKVDKVAGKGLSTNDFTNADKTKLDGLVNYDDTQIKADIANKVDKVAGKQLSTEDFTTALKTKLENLDGNAEENVIEVIKVDGTALTPDANKAVNIALPAYTLVKNEARPGYASTYNLKKDGVVVGDTIEIPENSIIKGGSIGVVDTPDVPYPGAKVGDKYLDLELETTPASHVYVPLKDLIVGYTGGDGIDISAANEIRAQIDSNLANGLQATAAGIGLNLATVGTNGAMSKFDKYKLDNLSNYDDTAILAALDDKVNKVAGKGLSTNDYTTDEKNKLAGIERNAQVNAIETIKVNNAIVGPVNKTVSLTIPTKTSQITNDLNFISDANYVHTDNNFTDSEKNKLAGLSNYNDSDLRNAINNKQDELVSGTNIKTINNQSLLGSGNIEINSECKLTSTLTANQTVGGVDAGDTFAVGTTLESIIRKILYRESGPTPVTNYTVSFNTYGGSSISSQVVEDGNKATRPATDPIKSGYTFDDWYTTGTYETLFNFNNVITADTIVHAKWNAIPVPTYTVAFDSHGGSAVSSQTVDEGSRATRPANPTKADNTFDDWYTDSTYLTKYDFSSAVMSNMTLHAKWNPVVVNHTVTYYDTDGTVLLTQTVEDNTRTTRPSPDPTKSGYTFDNWYSDQALTTAFDFRTYILADTSIYAKFIETPVIDNYDVYIGGMDNATASTAAIFASKTVDQLVANVVEQHMVSETQPFVTTLSWAGDASKNVIYYIMLKDGVEPAGATLTSLGISSSWTGDEIKNPTYWRATHSDVQINGVNYKVYGLRGKFNNTDTIALDVSGSTPATTYQVSFNTHGGSSVPTQTVQEGYKATKPNDPTKSGYTFDNWYTSDTYATVFDFDTTINTNTEIHAKWIEVPVNYTVSFDTHGGSTVSDQTVVSGGHATRPATDPTKPGYTFDDWYTDTTYTIAFDFTNATITENTTIHARWNAVTPSYTVSFNTHGGSSIASQTVSAGNSATRPATDPTKAGNTFDNWYTNDSYTTLFNFSTPINSNTEIHANWIPDIVTHTVTFYDDTTVLSTETINDGGKATRPATDPTKPGYTFDDWYTDTTYTIAFDFTNTVISADTGVYAKFDLLPVTHTVTFYDMNSQVISTETVNDNTRVTRPSDPTPPTGYTFDNWYTDTTYTTTFDFRTYIVADTDIYAKFVETPVVTTHDLYIGGMDNATASTAAIFAGKTVDQLNASVLSEHDLGDTQPFRTVLTFAGDGSKNVIYYVMIKSGVEPAGAQLTSAGITSGWTGSEIKDPSLWRATHDDVQINGITYKVYGLRGKFNNDDYIDFTIE